MDRDNPIESMVEKRRGRPKKRTKEKDSLEDFEAEESNMIRIKENM